MTEYELMRDGILLIQEKVNTNILVDNLECFLPVSKEKKTLKEELSQL